VLAGLAALFIGIRRLNDRAHGWTGMQLPASNKTVFAPGTVGAAFASGGTVWLIGLGGLLIGLLGLAWLVFQLPRIDRSPVFQLHDDARTGLIRCDAKVISRALEERIEQLPGVAGADATIRGTAAHPRLLVDLDVDQRSELPTVTRAVIDRAGSDLATTLESEIDELTVRVNVGATPTRNDRTAVVAGARRNAVESVPA